MNDQPGSACADMNESQPLALHDIDSAERVSFLRATIRRKGSLRMYYQDVYKRYLACVNRSANNNGLVLELGSGGGFAKAVVPGLISTDVIPYDGIDQVVDARRMQFANDSLKAILMFNVFHHISDVESFLREADRCLQPGGRVLIVDQYRGWISQIILRYFHHEHYDDKTPSWKFDYTGPLSSANGALAWIVFCRDREKFQRLFPGLQIAAIRLHSPFCYWLCGGLKRWNLIPARLYSVFSAMDAALVKLVPPLASFFDIELVKAKVE